MDRMHAPGALKLGVALTLGMAAGAAGYGALAAGQSPPDLAADERRLLQELAARDAIREQIYNYARGLDRMDRELVDGDTAVSEAYVMASLYTQTDDGAVTF